MRGLAREGVKLRATFKASVAIDGSSLPEGIRQRFHLDTVELYSNRSRRFFAKASTTLFSQREELIAF